MSLRYPLNGFFIQIFLTVFNIIKSQLSMLSFRLCNAIQATDHTLFCIFSASLPPNKNLILVKFDIRHEANATHSLDTQHL